MTTNEAVGGELTGASRDRMFTAWAGTRDHLTELFAIIGKHTATLEEADRAATRARPVAALEEARNRLSVLEGSASVPQPEEAAEDATAEDRYRADSARLNWSYLQADVNRERVAVQRAEAELARVDSELDRSWKAQLELTTNNETLEYTGPAVALAAPFDTRVKVKFDLRAPTGYSKPGRIDLRLTDERLYLKVTGESSAWTNAAFAELDGNISRSVPWWRFLRDRTMALTLWFATSFLAVSIAVIPSVSSAEFATVVSAYVTLLWICLLIGIAGGAITRRAIPVFQVLDSAQQAKGARAISVLGASAAQIALGVVFNVLS